MLEVLTYRYVRKPSQFNLLAFRLFYPTMSIANAYSTNALQQRSVIQFLLKDSKDGKLTAKTIYQRLLRVLAVQR